jgi:hypothetical protein
MRPQTLPLVEPSMPAGTGMPVMPTTVPGGFPVAGAAGRGASDFGLVVAVGAAVLGPIVGAVL